MRLFPVGTEHRSMVAFDRWAAGPDTHTRRAA